MIMAALSDRRILRGDFDADYLSPSVTKQLDVYREALVILFGKAVSPCV